MQNLPELTCDHCIYRLNIVGCTLSKCLYRESKVVRKQEACNKYKFEQGISIVTQTTNLSKYTSNEDLLLLLKFKPHLNKNAM